MGTYGQGCTLSIQLIPTVACTWEDFNSCPLLLLFICCSVTANYTSLCVSANSNTLDPHPKHSVKFTYGLERMGISGFNSTEVTKHKKKLKKT